MSTAKLLCSNCQGDHTTPSYANLAVCVQTLAMRLAEAFGNPTTPTTPWHTLEMSNRGVKLDGVVIEGEEPLAPAACEATGVDVNNCPCPSCDL